MRIDVVGSDPQSLMPEAQPVQRFGQGLDHRDAAGDGGLEAEVDALLAGQAEQLTALVRDQLLVRGHDRLLRGDGGAMV